MTQTSSARATPDVAYDAVAEPDLRRVRLVSRRIETLGWVAGRRHQRRRAAVVGDPGDRRSGPGRQQPVGPQQLGAQQVMDDPVPEPGRLPRHHQRDQHRQPAVLRRAGLRLRDRAGHADGQPDRRLARWQHQHDPARHHGRSPRRAAHRRATRSPITVTAENPTTGSVDTGFTGTISFTSTDSKIQGLPSTYTFTTDDAGWPTSPSRSRPPAPRRSPRRTHRVGHLDDHGQPRRGEQVRDLRPPRPPRWGRPRASP